MGQELTTNAQTNADVTNRVSGFTPKQVDMIRYYILTPISNPLSERDLN